MEILDLLALLIILLAFLLPVFRALIFGRKPPVQRRPSPIQEEETFYRAEPTEELSEPVEPPPLEADVHYVRDEGGASRVRKLLNELPSPQEMVILHEIFSPPKSL